MSPEQAIAMLDRQIEKHGQSVTILRLVPNHPIADELNCRAFVRGYKPDELANGVQQGDSLVVISPSSLDLSDSTEGLPRVNNKIEIAGRRRNIQAVDPVYLDDALVRLNLQIRG